MQFSSIFSVAALAAIATASPIFKVITIRSGSQFQYQNIIQKDGQLYVSAQDSPVTLILDTSDGTLSDSTTRQYIQVHDTLFYETSRKDATKGFAIKDGYLTLNDEAFYACGAGHDEYKLTTACSTDEPLALKVVDQADTN
ncbi:uncharacterized protein CANTADRAFT_26145 [Suhomyces tanzawaensis NRRL Y-17324]|uniref:Cell wall protein n=1 Tax=Suhomyces tanzawaensis NRRL Y-17324 TaxID=984487 RepID=A0A1E4SHU7_9ASCO|nr:uncharacterized protein CANTADRAFT_26145 [Suhomyces tanzawaensis NRRL Y-17324]ODV79089.1 hypothetical protein CANTADRAFT_26145 [Suhomyces tanzawaensis NRRL Y-17324]